MDDLIARIKAEKWYMVLEYVPQIDTFICELSGDGRHAWGRAGRMESAIIGAIREMDSR